MLVKTQQTPNTDQRQATRGRREVQIPGKSPQLDTNTGISKANQALHAMLKSIRKSTRLQQCSKRPLV